MIFDHDGIPLLGKKMVLLGVCSKKKLFSFPSSSHAIGKGHLHETKELYLLIVSPKRVSMSEPFPLSPDVVGGIGSALTRGSRQVDHACLVYPLSSDREEVQQQR